MLSFPLQHFPARPVFHLDDRSQPALDKPLFSKPPTRAIKAVGGGVAASCGTGTISYTRCSLQPRGVTAVSAPRVGAAVAGTGVRESCPGLESRVWASAAHQLGAGPGQVRGAACCKPSGVPGPAGQVVSLKRCCSWQPLEWRSSAAVAQAQPCSWVSILPEVPRSGVARHGESSRCHPGQHSWERSGG